MEKYHDILLKIKRVNCRADNSGGFFILRKLKGLIWRAFRHFGEFVTVAAIPLAIS